jgi:hypothetical protein
MHFCARRTVRSDVEYLSNTDGEREVCAEWLMMLLQLNSQFMPSKLLCSFHIPYQYTSLP